MIGKQINFVNKAKEYIMNAFAASDLDGNGVCNFEEWILLNRHIEGEKNSIEELTNLYFDNADIETEGSKNMSFDKFASVSVQYNLFSEQA